MDKDLLFKDRLPEADVDVPGVGTVRVRGMTRGEVFLVQKTDRSDVGAMERKIVATGMVDPELTQADVRRWQDSSPAGEIDLVVDKIRELSGLSDDAEKQAVLAFRDEPGDGVPVLPGAEAVDDGGDPAPGDG